MTTSEIIKPMLASAVTDYSKITWPKLVSPKLDGVRAIVNNGVVYSRSGKPIRSKAVQELFGKEEYNGLDGELIYGDPTAKDVFNKTSSFVMSEDVPKGMSSEQVVFHIFDCIGETSFQQRFYTIENSFAISITQQCTLVPQSIVSSLVEMSEKEEHYLSLGYEGVMLRNPQGLYKHGRATEKSQDLLKVKRFVDAEAEIIGYEELLHNNNEPTINELGYTERSSHKENLIGANTLGALICKTSEGVVFKIGTGYDTALRQTLWSNKESLVGKIAKYKYFEVGVKEAPRFPTFIGIRDKDDM